MVVPNYAGYFLSHEVPTSVFGIFGHKMDPFPTFVDFVSCDKLPNLRTATHDAYIQNSLEWVCSLSESHLMNYYNNGSKNIIRSSFKVFSESNSSTTNTKNTII
jgi:hypothetical protein